VTADGLVDALRDLRDTHRAGELAPNLAGRTFALEEFNETRLAARLAALVRERV
jgi:hypothetical protein